jgi:hypothetical protein
MHMFMDGTPSAKARLTELNRFFSRLNEAKRGGTHA